MTNGQKGECEQGRHEFSEGQCVHCGDMDREGEYPEAIRHIAFSKPQNVSREWAKLFLYNWNRAVKLWDGGTLFQPMTQETKVEYGATYLSNYTAQQRIDQKMYGTVCQSWLAPNGCVDPHIEANNISSECSCSDCLLERGLQ